MRFRFNGFQALPFLASLAALTACEGDPAKGKPFMDPQTVWEGEFPPEALVITSDEMRDLVDQDSVRFIARTDYEGRPAKTLFNSQLNLSATPAMQAGGASTALPQAMPAAEVARQIQQTREASSTRENREAVYRLLRSRLPESLQGAAPALPASLDSLTEEQLSRRTAELARLLLSNEPAFPASSAAPARGATAGAVPPSHASIDCSGDEGALAGVTASDAAPRSQYAPFAPGGLVANVDFALKGAQTCVKNQAARGTCVAFALASAMETELAAGQGRFVNLSEQDLYSHMKNIWSVQEYGDGSGVTWAFGYLTGAGGYHLPQESVWGYNGSWARLWDYGGDGVYTNSCYGYPSPECSDTAHQARLKCAVTDLDDGTQTRLCGLAGPIRTGDAFRAESTAELWDSDNTSGSVERIAAIALSGKPVAISLLVTPTFDAADSSGFVGFSGAGETDRGGHAITVMGYVSNARMVEIFGPGARQGAGGGFLIAKNSWGPGFADHGYMNLPLSWLAAYGYSATALTGRVTHEK